MNHFILDIEQGLSPKFCQHLIHKFNQTPNKKPGLTGAGVDKSKKDSTDIHLDQRPEWQKEKNDIANAILLAIIAYARRYPFILTGAISPSMPDKHTGEMRTVTYKDIEHLSDQELRQLIIAIFAIDEINMQHYQKGVGGYHHWHSEHYPHPRDPQQKSLHRVLLWLIYLNDIDEGGETEFFYQDFKVKPTQGRIIVAPCGFSHTHRGCIPVSADKYVLASWIMYKPAQRLYAPG